MATGQVHSDSLGGSAAARVALRDRVASTPAAVEIRALLDHEATVVLEDREGAVLDNTVLDLAAIWNAPRAPLLETLSRQISPGRPVLALDATPVQIWAEGHTASAQRLQLSPAVVFTLAHDARFLVVKTFARSHVRKMVPADLLSVDDAALRAELAEAYARTAAEGRSVLVSTEKSAGARRGRAVAFAYAPYRCAPTAEAPGYFDISVDTLEEFRRRGHARRACAALIAAERGPRMLPVWGAERENAASLATAVALGFAPNGETIWVGGFSESTRAA